MKSSRKVIIDVGANVGDFAIEAARRNPEHLVIAIEPNPVLVETIESRIKQQKLQNIIVYGCAIGKTAGLETLHVSIEGDAGTTSLREFNREQINENQYWKTRTDLTHHSAIKVEVRTLQSILEEGSIEQVDFIKIDTQGNDLDSLISLGPITTLAGMLESPSSSKDTLYLGEPSLRESLVCLEERGYEIEKIKPNDPACAEVNVYFSLAGVNFKETVQALNLPGIYLFDGKDYWWNPTNAPTNSFEAYALQLERNSSRLEKEVNRLEQEVKTRDSTIQDLSNSMDKITQSITWKFSSSILRVLGKIRGIL
jgi:FkbM family methyltransferase